MHGEAEAILSDILASQGAPLSAMTPEEARANFLERAWLGEPAGEVKIETRLFPGPGGPTPIRSYASREEPSAPVLIFFHGGGFVLGSLDEFDPFCSLLTRTPCKVISVGYRLAPEAPYPAAVEDAVAATRWVAAHAEELGIDRTRMAVMGDSAGGNLATVTAMMIRDQGGAEIALQVLVCPWLDLSRAAEEAVSFRHFGDGLWLSTANIHWYRGHYLGKEEQATLPSVSPLLAEDLRGLPPALIITAEFDVLADQGEAYTRRLQVAGVPVTWMQYPGMLHDFVILPGKFSRAWDAIKLITATLDGAFRAERPLEALTEPG